MRYLTVTYIRKPDGQMDEVVAIERQIKNKVLAGANVILDFRDQTVLKCTMNGSNVPKEWNKIRDFYYQYYQRYIDVLEKAYAKENNPN